MELLGCLILAVAWWCVNGPWEKFVLLTDKPQKWDYSISLCGKGKSIVYLAGFKRIVMSSLWPKYRWKWITGDHFF